MAVRLGHPLLAALVAMVFLFGRRVAAQSSCTLTVSTDGPAYGPGSKAK